MNIKIRKKWNKLEFHHNHLFYEIKFRNFVWKKKMAIIYENSKEVGSVCSRKKIVIGFNRQYTVELNSRLYCVDKTKNVISTDNIEFKFLSNKVIIVYQDTIKSGRFVYHRHLFSNYIDVQLNSEILFFDFLALFAALSCDKVDRSFAGDPMDS